MGLYYQFIGLLDEAFGYFQRVLDVRRNTLDDEHILTIAAVNNVGAALSQLGKLDDARPLLEQALTARRQQLGNACFAARNRGGTVSTVMSN